MEKKGKTLGFALGAGGACGVAHVGFLRAMEEAGIYPDYIAGCSMGSIVGAAYAWGMSVDDIQKAVYKLRMRHLIRPTFFRGGLFSSKKMQKILRRYMGEPTFSDLKIPFRCIAVDLLSQQSVTLTEGSVVESICASSCIPMVFRPVKREGQLLVDGGVLTRVPYKEVKEMGADVVVAVDVLGWRPCRKNNPSTVGVLLGIMDITDNIRTQGNKEKDKDSYDVWVEPQLSEMSQYAFKNFELAYERGYEAGKASVEQIKKALQS
ncbi:MAG: patatin-like phospholipase family protein [Clostridia bacterium]|nr:patatin-like phospholipase family protein [Clostridia bacterium]